MNEARAQSLGPLPCVAALPEPGAWKPPRVSSAMPGPDGPPPSRAVERVSCARGHAPPRGPSAVPLPPSTLRNVILADLSDVARLLALHQHAIARGWLQGGEAAQLNAVAAAVHTRRVGEAPCRHCYVISAGR